MSVKRKRAAPALPVAPGEIGGITCLVRVADGVVEAVCTAECTAALGVTAGQSLPDAFPAAPRLLALVERAARTGKLVTLDLPLPTANDPLMRCTGMPVPTREGVVTHVALTLASLPTGMLRSLPPQISSEMNGILAALADGIIIYDRDGDALYYNPTALEILGWKQAGIDPRTVPYAERMAIYQMATLQGEPLLVPGETMNIMLMQEYTDQEWRMCQPGGSRVIISLRPALIRDDLTGEVLGAVHLIRDITAWREGDAIKDEFMNVAGHELRAPLQPLILASRFIQRWAGRPERADDLSDLAEQIVTQAKRMSLLVQDMLDMTRINAGRFGVQPTACDLAGIVRNAVEEQRAVTHRAITFTGTDEPLPILAEDERLWQALTNLIQNAVKYSVAPAPVVVTLSLRADGDAAWAHVAVQDFGCGIPPDHLPRVFERFYRASVTYQLTPQQQDGLGLGLYITQAIIAAHGGRIWAESVVGEGSTFFIELPIHAGE